MLAILAVATGCSGLSELQTADGRTRRYLLRAPAEQTPAAPRPLLLVFHGGGGNPEGAEDSTAMTEAALQAGYVVVYPEGVGKTVLGKLFGTWNAGECCGTAVEEQVDDVAFVDQLLDVLIAEHAVDPNRVYATGLSNGAFMVGRLACELSPRIAAIAPIAGVHFTAQCQPERPVPVMMIHGTEDACVPIEGGEMCGGCFSAALEENLDDPPDVQDDFACDALPEAAGFWAAHNACSGPSTETQVFEDVACVRQDGCADGSEVMRCVVQGGGHTWPGGNYNCNPRRDYCAASIKVVGSISAWDANAAMLDFFSRHTGTSTASPG